MKLKLAFLFMLAFVANMTLAQMPAGFGKNKVDASAVPNSYNFSWKYTMEVQGEKGKIQMDYLLEPNAEYFATSVAKANGMVMIMDNKNKLTVTAFDQGGQKMATASKIPDYTAMAAKEGGKAPDFTYKSLPEKTILGYKCKGVEANSADNKMIFYYTNDAKVAMADLFKSPQSQKMPDAFKDYFKTGDKPLMMSMEITDLKKGKTTTMNCVGLEKSAFTFNKSDYRFM